MPLLASPNRGYADWQRVDNWDSGTLWAPVLDNQGVTVNGPIMDVSRYGYLGGYCSCPLNRVKVSMVWYEDAAATITLGIRQFILSDNVASSAQLRMPNLGPFARIQLEYVGVNYSFHAVVIGTNRDHPLEVIPLAVPAVLATNVVVGGSTEEFFQASAYIEAPSHVWCNDAGGSNFVMLQILDETGTWVTIRQDKTVPGDNDLIVNIPFAPWRVGFNNVSVGATTISLVVSPSPSGGN